MATDLLAVDIVLTVLGASPRSDMRLALPPSCLAGDHDDAAVQLTRLACLASKRAFSVMSVAPHLTSPVTSTLGG